MATNNGILALNNLGLPYRKFVEGVANGMSSEVASKEAGFHKDTGFALMRRPEIAAAVHQEVARRLATEGGPLGYKILVELAKDVSCPKGVRADCAKTLLSRAGHVEPRGAVEKADTKELTAMSQDELRAVINDCEGELGARAQPIGAPLSSEAVDIFE